MLDQEKLWENCPPELGALALLFLAAGVVLDLFLCLGSRLRAVAWRDRIQVLRERPLCWTDLGLLVSALLFLQGLAKLGAAALQHWKLVTGDALETAWMLGQSVILPWMGLLLAGILLWRRRVSGGIGYVAIMPFVVFAAALAGWLLVAFGHPPSLQEIAVFMTAPHNPWVLTYSFFLTLVLAPVFEEVLFRGFILPLFARGIGIGPAVLLTSAIFAALHGDLSYFAPLFVLAVGFSLAYIYSGSLLVPIAMHALLNGVNLVLLLSLRK